MGASPVTGEKAKNRAFINAPEMPHFQYGRSTGKHPNGEKSFTIAECDKSIGRWNYNFKKRDYVDNITLKHI
jgi:hypothetical protein